LSKNDKSNGFLFTELRDNTHFGRRVGVVDAQVHLSAQSLKDCYYIDGTPK
jgi:hypothetical protein